MPQSFEVIWHDQISFSSSVFRPAELNKILISWLKEAHQKASIPVHPKLWEHDLHLTTRGLTNGQLKCTNIPACDCIIIVHCHVSGVCTFHMKCFVMHHNDEEPAMFIYTVQIAQITCSYIPPFIQSFLFTFPVSSICYCLHL